MATTYGLTFSCANGSTHGALVTVTGTAPTGALNPQVSAYGQPSGENGGKLYGQGWPTIKFNANHGTLLTGYVTDSQNGKLTVDKTVNYTVTCAGTGAIAASHPAYLPTADGAAVSVTTVLALAAAVVGRRLRG